MTLALMVLVLGFQSVCNEIPGRGQPASSKTQIACSQLRASHCSHAIGWDLRCSPVRLKVTTKSKGRPPGYRSIKAGKVKINVKRHVTQLSWDAASRVCQSEGGALVKTDTKEKETAIKKKLKIKGRLFSQVNLWIGLKYFKVKRMFLWTDNTTLMYKNWGTGEPSHTWRDTDGTILREDCGALAVSLVLGIYWNDRQCSKTSGFICEVI